MNIIQDYSDWRDARKYTKKVKFDLKNHIDAITHKCDMNQLLENRKKEDIFCACAPKPENTQDWERAVKEYVDKNGPIYRASACFYRIHEEWQSPFPMFFKPTVIDGTHLYRCINNCENGFMSDASCGDCPHFKELVVYNSLRGQVMDALKKQEQAKQKLLDNFRFWKTK